MKLLQNLKTCILLALSVVVFASCSDNDPPQIPPMARVAIFNAYSPITSTQVRLNDLAGIAIPYGEARGFFEFPTVSGQTFTFLNQTTNQVIVDRAALRLELERFYTGIVYGNTIPGKFILLNDTALQNPSTNPRIRFLNLAEGVQAVDLFIGNEKVESLSNRAPEVQANAGEIERFILSNRAAGASDIAVRDLQGNTLATLSAYNFSAGRHYSVMLVGDAAFNSESPNIADRPKALRVIIFLH